MERLKEVIRDYADIQEAWLVNDRTVELLMQNRTRFRITAAENMKHGGYQALHHKAVDLAPQENDAPMAWALADLPWARGDSAEDCLVQAVLLMRS